MSRRRRGYVGLDEERARRARATLDRIRNKLIERNSVVDIREDLIYETLVAWGEPLTKAQIAELLHWGPAEMSGGDVSPLNKLVWEGRVGVMRGPDNRRTNRYYPDPNISNTLIKRD